MATVRDAQAALTVAGGQLQALDDEGAALSEELDARRAGADLVPPLPPLSASDRSDRLGAAFFQLVDFSPSLTEPERAGLEAAMQGSGLLNAWVSADGKVADPDLQDLIATPEPSSLGEEEDETLLAALVPVPGPGCAVTPGILTHVLASVRLADNPATSSLEDSSCHALAAGVPAPSQAPGRKDTAEYVGPAAREASRLRRIAVLTALLEELQDQARTAATPLGGCQSEPGRLGGPRAGHTPQRPPSRSRRACWQRQGSRDRG